MTTASPEREWGTGVCCVIVCGPLARVAEWQTRQLQVLVSERAWGFKSPLAHNSAGCSPGAAFSAASVRDVLRLVEVADHVFAFHGAPAGDAVQIRAIQVCGHHVYAGQVSAVQVRVGQVCTDQLHL